MSDRLTSWLRTVVPALWAALVAWLVSLGVPTWVTDALSGLGGLVLVPVVLAAVYSGLRELESHLPAWLTAILALHRAVRAGTRRRRRAGTGEATTPFYRTRFGGWVLI